MINLRLFLVGTAALTLGACGTTEMAAPATIASSPPPQDPEWSIIQAADGSRPGGHGEGSFVHVDGKLVLIGGRGTPRTDIFDMASCTWSKGASAPFQVHHFQATQAEGDVYAIGAFTDRYPREDPVDNVMIYNLAEDSWRFGPEIPEDRRRGASASVRIGDWIYVIGGAQIGHVGGHTAWLDRFNFRTGEWQRLPDAPRKRDHLSAAVADGKIVVGGGRLSMAPRRTFQETIAEVDIYDPASNSWTTASQDIPNQRAGLGAAEFRGVAYFFGGESGGQRLAHREVQGYVPGKGFRALPNMPEGSHGFGVAGREENGDDALYYTGGVITRGGGDPWRDLARLGVGEGPCG